ncbi:hypothetical protein BBP40_002613 [Aspergillus hancockii]|nr:hypothetical protein BBP40_002613 [Aspergillus hancockii]
MGAVNGNHRSEELNAHTLPHCQALVEAIGHRMAYEAAHEADVAEDILALYEVGVLMNLPAWYVGKTGLNIQSRFDYEVQAMNSIILRLDILLDATGAEKYCTSLIVSERSWEVFVGSLQAYDGEGWEKQALALE